MKRKAVAAVLIGSVGLLSAYLWPRVAVAIVLLSHDALSRELMQDGWLEESRQQTIGIKRFPDQEIASECSPHQQIEWRGLPVAFDADRFRQVETPSESMLRFVSNDDRLELTIFESPIGDLVAPIADHARLAKRYNGMFERGSRFDVLIAAIESGERSPFFVTPSAHFQREWLVRMKASVLRMGSEEGVWIVERADMRAIVPRETSAGIGADIYIPSLDRFFDVTIRGVADSREAVAVWDCVRINAGPGGANRE